MLYNSCDCRARDRFETVGHKVPTCMRTLRAYLLVSWNEVVAARTPSCTLDAKVMRQLAVRTHPYLKYTKTWAWE